MNAPLFRHVTDFHRLCLAARRAARGKRNRAAMATMLFHLETEILQLQRELLDQTYRPRPYRTFTVSDPKPRAISAADARDRVVHHALCAALEPVFEAVAADESYACRPEKGSHAAVARAQALARQWPFFLKLDIRKFFESVSHQLLKDALRQTVGDPGLLWLAGIFIDHGAPGSPLGFGLPIGNLTSQHFANFYLGSLDRFVLRTPGVCGYIRYMDDELIFAREKRCLWACAREIDGFLKNCLCLELKKEAVLMAPTTEGVPFMGFRVFPSTLRLDGRARRRLISRWREAGEAIEAGAAEDDVRASIQSAWAHVAHADTLALRRSLVQDSTQGLRASQARTG